MQLRLCLLAVFPAAFSVPVTAVEPGEVRQWHVEGVDEVVGTKRYELHNLRRRTLNLTSQLGYTRWVRSWATDMDDAGWTGTEGGTFAFLRPNVSDRSPLRETDAVALYNSRIHAYFSGSWRRDRRHKSHTVAVWSSTPLYIWMLRDRVGPDFALYNRATRKYLILGGKENGVNATLCNARRDGTCE